MYVTIFFLFITKIFGISIPYIQNVVLQSSIDSNINITVLYNRSCNECLCEEFILNNSHNYLALNCFLNGTCQFFQNFPLYYKINSSPGTQLYFLQNQFPNASQCCMSNITDLLTRLKNATPIIMNLTFPPAAFGYDEANPNEVAVSGWSLPILYWFNPNTMMFIRNSSINASLSLAVYNNQTFTATDNSPLVSIRDSQTNNYLENITYSSFGLIRKLIFINNGQTAIFSTQNNYSLTMFNVNSPTNYTLQQEILFPLPGAHGIAKINDTLIYASSWTNRSILSYTYENSTWIRNVFIGSTATSAGAHIATDECGRVWFVNTQFGLRIYDSTGLEIGNWNMSLSSSNTIYDILILPNYVLLISHRQQQKIFRYDPQVTCL